MSFCVQCTAVQCTTRRSKNIYKYSALGAAVQCTSTDVLYVIQKYQMHIYQSTGIYVIQKCCCVCVVLSVSCVPVISICCRWCVIERYITYNIIIRTVCIPVWYETQRAHRGKERQDTKGKREGVDLSYFQILKIIHYAEKK